MTKEIWINLPVKNINKSKEFFSKLGFSFNSQYNNSEESACLVIGEKNVIVMLFTESTFENFTGNKISDSNQGTIEDILTFLASMSLLSWALPLVLVFVQQI